MIAIDTLSASSTFSAMSGAVSSGSGSQGPTYASLRRLHGAQPVERLPGRDPDQVGALVAHLRQVDLDPPQPGLLEDVLGVGRRSEHLVGDGEEQVAVGDESLGRRVGGVVAHLSTSSPSRRPVQRTSASSRLACNSSWRLPSVAHAGTKNEPGLRPPGPAA